MPMFAALEKIAGWNAGSKLNAALKTIGENFGLLEPSVRTSAAANYQPVIGDRVVRRTAAGAQTLTIPTNATAAFPIGWTIEAIQSGAGALSIVAAGGVTIEKLAAKSLNVSAQYGRVRLIKLDTNVWHLSGELA